MRFFQFLQYAQFVAQAASVILLPVLLLAATRLLWVKAKKG